MKLKIFVLVLSVMVAISGSAHANESVELIHADPVTILTPADDLLPQKQVKEDVPVIIERAKMSMDENIEGAVEAVENVTNEHSVLDAPEEIELRNFYKIGAGDVLDVTVYREPELTKSYQVEGAGTISIPLLGPVKVEGLTLAEIEKLVTTQLSDGYLVDPSVAIEMESYRPFYIMGEVRRPGSYNYIENMNVLNAVAIGGGFTYRAKTKKITVIRDNEKYILGAGDMIMPGDILKIEERFF